MRELKFRAWNKDKKCFFKWDISMGFTGTDKVWGDVEQYTGLKDNNGKDIYENDVVKFTYSGKKRQEVVNCLGGCMTLGCCMALYQTSMDSYRTQLEVIGNIHQDKHLLK